MNFLLFSFANVLFFATFCLIVYFWAQAYFSTQRQQQQRRPLQYFLGCLLCYSLVQAAMYVLYFVVSYEQLLMVHSSSDCAFAVLVGVGFVVFWLKLSNALRLSIVDPPAASSFVVLSESGLKATPAATRHAVERQSKLKKLGFVACTGTAGCLVKAAIDVYQLIEAGQDAFPYKYWWLVITIYYTLDEVLTSLAILVILRKPKEPDDPTAGVPALEAERYVLW